MRVQTNLLALNAAIGGVENEADATIMATERGARQAREVGELMGTTADQTQGEHTSKRLHDLILELEPTLEGAFPVRLRAA